MSLPPPNEKLTKILRGLLIAEICITVISIPLILFSGLVTEGYLEQNGLAQPESSDAEMAVAAFSCVILIVMVACLIVSWIGLFNFWGWARWLYLGIMIGGIIIDVPISLFDLSFQWGFPAAIGGIGQLITGAIAAIILFSPIAARFNADTSSHPPRFQP